MWAFEYAESTAQELESDYGYKGSTGTCKATASKESRGIEATDYSHVQKDSVPDLKAAIAQGPTCVSVDANCNAFMNYSSGIFNPSSCSYKDLDHAITAVGYGSENGQDFFIVRNSWGTGWGEDGYIRVTTDGGKHGVCGILEDSTFVYS